ncbi:hypothetical protein TNCT_196421, partial [Trichonephila clavata]
MSWSSKQITAKRFLSEGFRYFAGEIPAALPHQILLQEETRLFENYLFPGVRSIL